MRIIQVKCLLAAALWLVVTPLLLAGFIGTNTPAQEISSATIATLPRTQQRVWKQYLDRSNRQLRMDQDFLRKEMKKLDLKEAILPPAGRGAGSLPLNRPAAWYGSTNAQLLADNVVSFQTPAGGWSKNLDFSRHPRAAGEHFAPDNLSRFSNPSDSDLPRDSNWNYVGTFDNDATTTQMRFLAKAAALGSPAQARKWRASFMRGVDYILAAQFPNGGWPQVWPLQGGYHDSITFNDSAVVLVLGLLRDLSEGQNEFAFASAKTRRLAAASLQRGIQCTLAAQIRVDGRLTVWCQQHNALTLIPASGRNYEMPAEVTSESASVMLFLMALPKPDPAVIAAVDAAAAWFRKTAISNVVVADRRALQPSPGSGPLWPRFAQIGTDRPIFGDRDKSIHDELSEISQERRNGYSWYNGAPRQALERYEEWRAGLAPKTR